MKLSDQQVAAVLRLPGPERYRHFVKQVADRQEVWSLYNDGWALAATDDGAGALPFWPAQEYAAICASDVWEGYRPKQLSIPEFEDLLARLERDGIQPGVFYTPDDKGVIPSHQQLRDDLEQEMKRYE